jgi:hypothetical protein
LRRSSATERFEHNDAALDEYFVDGCVALTRRGSTLDDLKQLWAAMREAFDRLQTDA